MARMIRSAVWSYGAGLFQIIAAGDAITPDAARQTLFVDFHKYFFAQRILRRILTAVFLTVPTFPPGFGRQSSGTDGNVMHRPGGKNAVYASAYALYEGCGGRLKKSKYLLITVSFPHCPQLCPQGFSTNRAACGYPLRDLHKMRRQASTDFPLFRGL